MAILTTVPEVREKVVHYLGSCALELGDEYVLLDLDPEIDRKAIREVFSKLL